MTLERFGPLALVVSTAATGCAAAGPDAAHGAGYVLLDQAARQAVTLTQGRWSGAPVLPVALEVDEPVVVVSPAGTRSVTLQPGVLALIHGETGTVEWREVGTEVRADRLLVRATPAAADDLAALLGGQRDRRQRAGGLQLIEASDVFERASFLIPPDGIDEALPDLRVPDATGGLVKAVKRAAVDESAPLAPAAVRRSDSAPGRHLPELVGIYTSGSTLLVLDAAGGFSIEDGCSGEVRMAGGFNAVGDQVELRSASTGAIPLTRDGDDLLVGGVKFGPFVEPEPPRRADVAADPGGEP